MHPEECRAKKLNMVFQDKNPKTSANSLLENEPVKSGVDKQLSLNSFSGSKGLVKLRNSYQDNPHTSRLEPSVGQANQQIRLGAKLVTEHNNTPHADVLEHDLKIITGNQNSKLSKPNILSMQKELNKLGFNIRVDGIWGPETMRAVDMALGRDKDLPIISQQAYLKEGKELPAEYMLVENEHLGIVSKVRSGNARNYIQSLLDSGQMPELSGSFLEQLEELSKTLGVKTEELLALILFESNGDPSATNSLSGAVGLIQFLPSTLQSMFSGRAEFQIDGRNMTSTEMAQKVGSMSLTEQMPLVGEYLLANARGRKISSLEDLYMLVLHPKSFSKAADEAIFSKGSLAYENNPLDQNGDGAVTKKEATHHVRGRLTKANQLLADLKSLEIPSTPENSPILSDKNKTSLS